jgi:putative membrane protein
MDFATADLLLAIAHHLLIFALAGVIAYEFAVVRPGMTAPDIQRVGRVDLWYGILAGLILIVGFTRANVAAKGWEYYAHNHFFWAKIATFIIVGLLSVRPTMAFIAWRKALKADPGALPAPEAILLMRRFIWAQVVVFALIPVFAAAMARGFGELPS